MQIHPLRLKPHHPPCSIAAGPAPRSEKRRLEVIVVDRGVQVPLVHEVLDALAHLRFGEPPVELRHDVVHADAALAVPLRPVEDRKHLIVRAAAGRGHRRGRRARGRRRVRAVAAHRGGRGRGPRRRRPRRVVRVAVDHLEEVVRDLVEVRHRAHVERDHAALALERAEVSVHADVRAHFPLGFVLILAVRVVGVDPDLHLARPGAVVDRVHQGGGGVVGLDDLPEEGEVVDLLAVHLERVVLFERDAIAGRGGRREGRRVSPSRGRTGEDRRR
eukprot:30626-Pelagococcus_subviridis.AAC.4